MLNQKHVTFYARSSKVRIDVAERDVVLTYVLNVANEDLPGKLAFKGGTCLKKVYLGKTGRFSMDLDFTGVNLTPESLRERLAALFSNREHFGIDFEISESYSRPKGASYGSIVRYSHDWNPGSELKVEVSFREKPILPITELPLIKELYFKYCEIQPFKVPCIQLEELLAEKIRAAFQRLTARDLYDLYLFSKRPYDRSRVRALLVIKCWNVKDPFNPDVLLGRIEKGRYDWSGLESLVRAGGLPRERTLIRSVLNSYSYLKDLNRDLAFIVKDSKSHRYPDHIDSLCEKLRG